MEADARTIVGFDINSAARSVDGARIRHQGKIQGFPGYSDPLSEPWIRLFDAIQRQENLLLGDRFVGFGRRGGLGRAGCGSDEAGGETDDDERQDPKRHWSSFLRGEPLNHVVISDPQLREERYQQPGTEKSILERCRMSS